MSRLSPRLWDARRRRDAEAVVLAGPPWLAGLAELRSWYNAAYDLAVHYAHVAGMPAPDVPERYKP